MAGTITTQLAEELKVNAFTIASKVVVALGECDEALREVAVELLNQLSSGELTKEEAFSTTALLAEILFPNSDPTGSIGLDLEEAEQVAPKVHPEAGPILDEMDRAEATFAERLRAIMAEQGLTQAELAAKVGIGQPAISNMLNRTCSPQRKTVQKLATALSVKPEALWPTWVG